MTNPFRLLKLYRSADALVSVLDDGAKDGALYKTPTYWTRVVSAAMALVRTLPLPQGSMMKNFWQKLFMVTGAVASIGSQVQGLQLPLPPNVQLGLGLIVSIAGAIYHQVPGQPAVAPK